MKQINPNDKEELQHSRLIRTLTRFVSDGMKASVEYVSSDRANKRYIECCIPAPFENIVVNFLFLFKTIKWSKSFCILIFSLI